MRWSLLNPQHTPTQEGGGGGQWRPIWPLCRRGSQLTSPPRPAQSTTQLFMFTRVQIINIAFKWPYSSPRPIINRHSSSCAITATIWAPAQHRAQVPAQWGHGGRRGNNIIEVHQQRGRALYTSTNNTSVEMEKIFSFWVKLPTILLQYSWSLSTDRFC